MQSPEKGLFTQAAMVLVSRVPSVDEVKQALLLACPIEARSTRGRRHWSEGDSLLVLPFQPEKNGYLLIDIIERRWPDALGDLVDEPEVVAAWAAGHFGPLTYGGCLTQAALQNWKWKAGRRIQEKHTAFLRIRLTYLLGVPVPERGRPLPLIGVVNPLDELAFLTQVSGALLTLRGALGLLFPAGEALRNAAFVEERLNLHRGGGPPPIEVWTNVRFQMVDTSGTWAIMDTIGMAQMDLPDLEAAFPQDKHERFAAPEVEAFLLNQSLRLLEDRDAFTNPVVVGGPGDTFWRSSGPVTGFSGPTRKAIRFLPRVSVRPPAPLRDDSAGSEGKLSALLRRARALLPSRFLNLVPGKASGRQPGLVRQTKAEDQSTAGNP
jgi:hypothetical protein